MKWKGAPYHTDLLIGKTVNTEPMLCIEDNEEGAPVMVIELKKGPELCSLMYCTSDSKTIRGALCRGSCELTLY